jgi:16S rRNA (uracil1498-N3)-methyltransferase
MEILTRLWGEHVYAEHAVSGSHVVQLEADEQHHLTRVLRTRAGETVTVINGRGLALVCRLDRDGSLQVQQEIREYGEDAIASYVYCAVLKGDGLRDVVDAATCLGAHTITFVNMEHCEGKWDPAKRERLERVAIAAMKQCGRSRLPLIEYCTTIPAAIEGIPLDVASYFAHPHDGANGEGEDVHDAARAKALWVGPEGGFSDREVAQMLTHGARPLNLGRRRLRSELAVIAGLVALTGVRRS